MRHSTRKQSSFQGFCQGFQRAALSKAKRLLDQKIDSKNPGFWHKGARSKNLTANIFLQTDQQDSNPIFSHGNLTENQQYRAMLRDRISIAYLMLATGVFLAHCQNYGISYGLDWPPIRNFKFSIWTQPLCIFACLAMHGLTRIKRLSDDHILALGLIFQPITTFLVSCSFYYQDIPLYSSHTDVTIQQFGSLFSR
jgi:hypothetical protein